MSGLNDWQKPDSEVDSVVAAGESRPPLSLRETFADRTFVVIGGTGFLGKVWWVLLLDRFPDIKKLFLVVRPRHENGRTLNGEQRFWDEIATGACLDPLRERYGNQFQDFLREKIEVLEGDVVQPYCGISVPDRERLRGRVDAVVNASGVVQFEPPLDVALDVNAFGVQSLVALSRDIGEVPVMHTSTCFVAGYNTGIVEEQNPLAHPFPYAGKLERAHWDPDREISECLDIISQAKQRADDAFRQSHFLDQAKRNLRESGEPGRGAVLDAEIAKVRRRFIEAQLSELGIERARFWGWPNTYTYTKSIGEQIVAQSGLRFTVVRPAIIESCVEFPCPGWNEGINTSAPLIFSVRQGQMQMPGGPIRLDVIPCDMVATGMVLSLAELVRDEHKPVYQYGCSDTNPITMGRMYELSGLYKRKYYRKTGKGGPIGSYLAGHVEGALLSGKAYDRVGPKAISRGAKGLAGLLSKAPNNFAAALKPTVKGLNELSKAQEKVGDILEQFRPFTAELDYEFRSDNTRSAFARLSDPERAQLMWAPERIHWRKWFLNVHAPGLEKWVFPELEQKLKKSVRARSRHETLTALLQEVSERYELSVALQRVEQDGLSRVSFQELEQRALHCAGRLRELGVQRGDRVLLGAKNHPDWVTAFFGILFAGATVVPVDAEIDLVSAGHVVDASGAKVALVGEALRERLAELSGCEWMLLSEVARGPYGRARTVFEPEPAGEDDVAALIYTSGTTGKAKGVMLTHRNLTSLVASLAPLFPLGRNDRVLSVLPLHHTFELTCGLLLPLSRGSRIVYLDELNADKLQSTLKQGRITAMVGVPALWEMLERKILGQVSERGGITAKLFDLMVDLNHDLGKSSGVDIGKLLFGPVHKQLGGHLRVLVSGGAALGDSTHRLFNGLGLHLTEGYGLTEAAPVLSVAKGGPKGRSGQVGKPVPGVDLKIDAPNQDGVGEVLARGPNVMLGYADDPEATRAAIDDDGWLHTGDLGKINHRGELSIVGRAKDTIVTSTGENVYPDDVEARLGRIDRVTELAVVGVSDSRGGERVAVACVVEPQGGSEDDEKAQAAIARAIAELPPAMRPSVVTVFNHQLPKTSTRKVKRKEVRQLVERRMAERSAAQRSSGAATVETGTNLRHVQRAIGSITRREPSSIAPSLTLRGDLGCDSLMLLEVLVALEAQLGCPLDAELFADCQTVGDVERLLNRLRVRDNVRAPDDDFSFEVPEALRDAAMAWMSRAQQTFYTNLMHTQVSGRAFIPHNRNTLVVANHASHLDMGLIKYALAEYGDDMVSLAAQDYFFEGKWRKAYFENFSNLVPVSRSGSLRGLLRTAGDLLRRGRVVLLFPEGTRSTDGTISEFKPALGHLALDSQVDILPIWLGGTHRALPKGSTVLRSRKLKARIGMPIRYDVMVAQTAGKTSSEASRHVARVAREAVFELSQGRVLKLDPGATMVAVSEPATSTSAIEALFQQLPGRFVQGTVSEELSYYFSLGNEKWSLSATPEGCEVRKGKAFAKANCVLKTSPEMFQRIVDEGYTPTPSEFMSGAVKSNNVGLLLTFQKMFALAQQSVAE